MLRTINGVLNPLKAVDMPLMAQNRRLIPHIGCFPVFSGIKPPLMPVIQA